MVNYTDMKVRYCICRTGVILTALLVAVVFLSDAWSMSGKPEEPAYAPGEVLVRFNDDVARQRIEQIVAGENSTVREVIGSGAVHLIVLPDDMEVMDAVDRFSAFPEVKYAEPNFKVQRLEK